MAFGLKIQNSGGGLVVDSDAHGLHYLGQAAYIGNTTETNNSFIRNRVRRRYAITLPSASAFPVAAIRPTLDRWMSFEWVRRSAAGSATWHIDIYSADSTMLGPSIADMTASASAEVHVFTSGAVSGDAFGVRLFDSAGAVSWDFGAKPLFVKQVAAYPQRTDRATYRFGDAISAPGISTPLLIGAETHGHDNVRFGAGGSHNDSEYVFQLDGAGSIKRVLLQTGFMAGDSEDPPYPQPDWELPASTVFVLDAADYA